MSLIIDYGFSAPLAPEHWVVVVAGRKALAAQPPQPFVNRYRYVAALDLPVVERYYLGRWHGEPCFLLLTEDAGDTQPPGVDLLGLRSQLGVIDDSEFALVGRALQLANWLAYHQFCGRCGERNRVQRSEPALVCQRCDAHYYPRIAPCVIGLVQRGNRCLLAHNARFSEGLYSVLAGFIEPGENAEAALIREVYEEVGINVGNLEYIESQSWPFPSQLMLGFVAQYRSGDIAVDGVEITHADWFSADRLPTIPPTQTLSGKLIQLFCERARSP